METNTSTNRKSRKRLTLEEKIAKTLERKAEAEKKLKEKQQELKSLAMRKINKDRKERKRLRTHRLIQLGLLFSTKILPSYSEKMHQGILNALYKEIENIKMEIQKTKDTKKIKELERMAKDTQTQIDALNIIYDGEEL